MWQTIYLKRNLSDPAHYLMVHSVYQSPKEDKLILLFEQKLEYNKMVNEVQITKAVKLVVPTQGWWRLYDLAVDLYCINSITKWGNKILDPKQDKRIPIPNDAILIWKNGDSGISYYDCE